MKEGMGYLIFAIIYWEMRREYLIVGMMSGTSLDGVDLAACRFTYNSKWHYSLLAAQTIPYPTQIIETITHMQTEDLCFLQFKKEQIKYSQFIADIIQQFIERNQLTAVDYVSVHGHTIYHMPIDKITVQATNLNTIAAQLQLDVIGNFRELDVMRGGQGAPLAPFGEELFDGEVFINFGGIANIGYDGSGWDIHYCNLFFNKYSLELEGKEFDQAGNIGRKGKQNHELKEWLQQHHQNKQHLSLQRQGFQLFTKAINAKFTIPAEDIVATFYHFLAEQITQSVQEILHQKQTKQTKSKVICTGGGAKNTFLIELLQKQEHQLFEYVIPDQQTVDFKQAIIFAYLGLKFVENIPNCSKGIGGTLIKGKTYNNA